MGPTQVESFKPKRNGQKSRDNFPLRRMDCIDFKKIPLLGSDILYQLASVGQSFKLRHTMDY